MGEFTLPNLGPLNVAYYIVFQQFETSGLQAFYIHHHASIFRLKQLHEFAAGTYENENISVLHLAIHPIVHQPTQRTDALTHICPAGAQKVAHCIIQTKHECLVNFVSTLPSVNSLTR